MVGIRLFLLLMMWSWCTLALAHKPSDSYLRIFSGDEQLSAEWDIALKDLEFLIGLDGDQNSEITWGELKAKRQAIAAHALSRLQITADGHECHLRVADLMVNRHSDGSYAVLSLQSDCPSDAAVVTIDYNLLFDVDPTHRGLALYTTGTTTNTQVLSPDERSLEIRAGESALWQSFAGYVREGSWHIWIGYDHILFLLSLLLPAVLVRRDNGWRAVDNFRSACRSVLKIVTVFTLAHSVTLWLAVMGYVTLPSRLVEAAIALSIVVTALNNLYPVLPFPGWAIAFVFGLVHGFGFANVLLDLGLSNASLALALLGFNVGVELGQIVIVIAFMPVAFLLRGTDFYRQFVFRYGSVLVAMVGGMWAIERLMDIKIVGV